MINDLASVMFDEQALATKNAELGKLITQEYKGKEVIVVGILKGSVVFFSDLIRQIDMPIQIDFMVASS